MNGNDGKKTETLLNAAKESVMATAGLRSYDELFKENGFDQQKPPKWWQIWRWRKAPLGLSEKSRKGYTPEYDPFVHDWKVLLGTGCGTVALVLTSVLLVLHDSRNLGWAVSIGLLALLGLITCVIAADDCMKNWSVVKKYWYGVTPLEWAMRLTRHLKRSIETAQDSAIGEKSPLGQIVLRLIERRAKLTESLIQLSKRADAEAPGGIFAAGVADTERQLAKINEALVLIYAPIHRIHMHYAALLEQADKAAGLVGDIMVLEQAKENCSLAEDEMAQAKRLIVETLTCVRQDTARLERQIAVLNAEAAAKSWSTLTFKDGQDLETLKTWLNQVLPDSPVMPVASVSDETDSAPALAAAPLPVH